MSVRQSCGKVRFCAYCLGEKKGAVYYDGKDITGLDERTLRKNIGSVMQDGEAVSGGYIFNIVLANSLAHTGRDAWEAAGIAGIDDDIAAMPMGMHTTIAESSGISPVGRSNA